MKIKEFLEGRNIFDVILATLLILGSLFYGGSWAYNNIGAQATGELVFTPVNGSCVQHGEPGDILPGWNESFDFNDRLFYCLHNESVFYVSQEVRGPNSNGDYFTLTPSDLWTNDFLLTEQANVRNVEIQIEMYAPSHPSGQCLATSVNPVTGLPNSPMFLLVANHQNGFSETSTFNDAFIGFNDQQDYPELLGTLACDEWVTFQVPISDFTNDFGSSFAGNSKTIGTLGLEVSNVYIRDIKVIGADETIDLW